MSNIINTGWTPPIMAEEQVRAIHARMAKILDEYSVRQVARNCARGCETTSEFVERFDQACRRLEHTARLIEAAYAERKEARLLREEADDNIRTMIESSY